MQQNEPRPNNNKEATLLAEFMRLKKNPDFKMSWEEFLQQYLPMLSWMDDENEPYEDGEFDEDDYYEEDEENNDNNREEMPW